MELHKIISVRNSNEKDVYIARVELTDIQDERYECDYVVRADDNFGLAPVIREAVSRWISEGRPINPYVPPSPEDERNAMPSLSARQLRLGLIGGGITLAQIEAAIASIEDDQERAVAQVEWEYATQFNRTHPLLEQVGNSLGLMPEQIDAMWQSALEL